MTLNVAQFMATEIFSRWVQINKIKQVLPLLVNKNPRESSIEESKPSIDTQMFQFKGNIVSTYLHMNYKMLENISMHKTCFKSKLTKLYSTSQSVAQCSMHAVCFTELHIVQDLFFLAILGPVNISVRPLINE